MAATTGPATTQRSEWFESWFDSPHYHKLYAYRDDAEAARFLDELIGRLGLRRGVRVLDLGCGSGRHSKYLASKGLQVTGIDLAAGSIREAQASQQPSLRFLRHDMRVPFGRGAFDYVFNFFTSFGYFEEPREHLAVVRNMATSLRPGGRLVLDYLNVRYAEARLTPEEPKEIDGVTYKLTRWTDARHLFKRIVVEGDAGEPLEYVERVARFALIDFERMFAAHNLSIETVYGDYRLNAYDPEASPRMILVARKRQTGNGASYGRDRFLRTRLSVSGVTPRYDASMNCGTRCTMDGYFFTNA
jgi:SAM-dependent methyltransferase